MLYGFRGRVRDISMGKALREGKNISQKLQNCSLKFHEKEI